MQVRQMSFSKSSEPPAAKDGELLEVTLDIIPDDEYEQRQEDLRRLNDLLPSLVGGP